MKKAITLLELLIAITLLGVIIIGAFAFENASRDLLRSSEIKVNVLNDLTFVLEHVHKNVLAGIGDITEGREDGRMSISGFPDQPDAGAYTLTIWQDTNENAMRDNGDTQAQYVFNPNPTVRTVEFWRNAADETTRETIAENLTAIDIDVPGIDDTTDEPDEGWGGVYINNMAMRHNPAEDADPVNNPELEVEDQYFFPLSQSLF